MSESKAKKAARLAAQPRPDFWSAEWVLDQKRRSPNSTPREICKRVIEEMGHDQVTIHALLGDIGGWKRHSPEFKAAFEALSPLDYVPGKGGQRVEDRPGMKDWKMRFAEAFDRLGGDKRAAADEVGVHLSTVAAMLRPGNPAFDQELYDACQIVYEKRINRAELGIDKAMQLAEEQEDARTLGWLGLSVLERLEKQLWGKSQVIEHRGTVEVNHRVERALGEAVSVSRGMFGPQPAVALPAGEVIEGQVIEVKEGVN
jgi:hypothetical protein